VLPADTGRLFAVVGGGRWARVYLSVMAAFDFPFRVVVVSSANRPALTGLQAGTAGRVDVVPDIGALPRDGSLVGALVANAAALHAETAARLLDIGASVLIEKPLALQRAQLRALFATAATGDLQIVPALTFLHCSYLENLARRLQAVPTGRPVGMRVEWHDPLKEQRHGETKSHDPGVSIAQDVMPHVWAVLAATLGTHMLRVDVQACEAQRGGRGAQYSLAVDGIPCEIDLQRDVVVRRRRLVMELAGGTSLALDFTDEPGTITLGTQSCSGDPGWAHALRPVRRQLQAFLDALADPRRAPDWRPVAERCTDLVEQSDRALKQAQCALLQQSPLSRVNADVAYAFREVLGARLREAGQPVPAGDRQAWFDGLDGLMHSLVSQPAAADWYSALQSLDTSAR